MAQNIETLLRRKFTKVSKSRGRNGIEYKVKCPYCGKKDKMYINPNRYSGVFNCYKCGKSGGLQELLSDWKLSGDAPVHVERTPMLPSGVQMPGTMHLVNTLEPDNPGVQYLTRLRSRRFDLDELSTTFGVHYCSEGKTYTPGEFSYNTANTLIFPLWMFGKVVGWQSRLLYTPDELTDDQCIAMGYTVDEEGSIVKPPKYWTSPGFNKGRVLYNFDQARRYPYVVVTEGVFDAFSVGPCAVATFGTGVSAEQCKLLKTYWDTVILLLDPDAAYKSKELIAELYRSVRVVAVNLGEGDAGDTERAVIWDKITEALGGANG